MDFPRLFKACFFSVPVGECDRNVAAVATILKNVHQTFFVTFFVTPVKKMSHNKV